jgi:tetratricopeptide (TPR) repeat protein
MSGDRIDELIDRWLSLYEAGRDVPPAELCGDAPELAEELGRRVEVLRRMADLGRRSVHAGSFAVGPVGTMVQTPSAAAAGPAVAVPSADTPFDPDADTPPYRPGRPPAIDAPDGYEIERVLGRGGMGVVYLARQTALNRPVAIKMILGGTDAGSAAVARFAAEAEAIAQVRHPNIVQVYATGTHRGQPFFSLEFCPGGGLDRKLAGTPLPPAEAAATVAAVAAGVAAAHAAGIIHRDLKPQNVLLAADGTPKVTDFGLAKRVGSASDLTATGAVVGTPSYMAPEQAAGDAARVGPAADVWAVGAVLYECLTGRPPFKLATALETVMAVIDQDPVPPSRLAPATPRDLETVCLKCLQKDPARRYPSAAAVADDLNRWRAGLPIVARPASRAERAVKWARRNPAAALSAGLVGLLVLTSVGGGLALAAYRTQLAENELARLQQRDRGREAVTRQLTDARGLRAAGRTAEARSAYAGLLALLDATPGGADPADEQLVRGELAEVDAVLGREDARRRARADRERFRTLADEATRHRLAHALAPADPGAARRAADAARRAVAVWGPGGPPADAFDPAERADLDAETRDLVALAGRPTGAVAGGPAAVPVPVGDGPAAVFARGMAAFERGDPAAGPLAERLLQVRPGHVWGRVLLAAARLREGRPTEAAEGLTASLALAPDADLARALRGEARAAAGDPLGAEDDFRAALDRSADPAVRLLAVTARGLARAARREWAGAEADLRAALAGSAGDPRLVRPLAGVLAGRGDAPAADATLSAALETHPTAGLHLDRGRLRRAGGRPARPDFEAAARVAGDPAAAEAALELARLDRADGTAAAVAAVAGPAAAPRSPLAAAERLAAGPAPPPGCQLFLAQLLTAAGRLADAEAALDRHLKLVGPAAEPEALALRGLLLSHRRRWFEAAEAYKAALDRAPPADRRELRLARAGVYMLSRNVESAAADYDAVLADRPDDPDGLCGRAEVRVRAGRLRDGLRDAAAVEARADATPRQLCLAARARAVAYQAITGRQPAAREQGFTQADALAQFAAMAAALRRAVAAVPPADRAGFWADAVLADTAFQPLLGSAALVDLDRFARAN